MLDSTNHGGVLRHDFMEFSLSRKARATTDALIHIELRGGREAWSDYDRANMILIQSGYVRGRRQEHG